MIGFLSDFGHADPYVGICHGVLARFAPEERIIDICHEVPRGNVRAGAGMLAQSVPYLPGGVYVAVVDPGVGPDRRGVVVSAGDSIFVGPDNGLLLWAADALGGPAQAHEITNHHLMITPVSYTFHGRDVFAPVAARLATGIPPTAVGPEIAVSELVRLPDPIVLIDADGIDAEVLGVDRYGNLQTAATATQLRSALHLRSSGEPVLVSSRVGPGEPSHRELDVKATYGETFGSVALGEVVVFEDSAGLVAVAVNGGDARSLLQAEPGSMLRLRRA
jgi:S-adenosyl-L-methionine hydrolase (adenosine-forming)